MPILTPGRPPARLPRWLLFGVATVAAIILLLGLVGTAFFGTLWISHGAIFDVKLGTGPRR
jgi:hypothetical protein